MEQNLIQIALDILKDEALGDVKAAAEKMDLDNYSMTWMYKSRDELFPKVEGIDVGNAMEEAYIIQNRTYEIINCAQGDSVVFIEMIESYPDTATGNVFRTPITLVLEFNGNKIVRGRHYTDPALSHEFLKPEQIYSAIGKIPHTKIPS